MIIQHNMAAANANRMLGSVVTTQSKSTEKLSSGYRINRAADDAAGLSISEKMRGQIRGLDQASTNAQDGISMIQTAEGALNETHSILQRMRELAVQASTGTETDDDRAAIQAEITELQDEIDRIGNTTQFNTMNLLDGTRGNDATSATLTVTAGTGAGAGAVTNNAATRAVSKTGDMTTGFPASGAPSGGETAKAKIILNISYKDADGNTQTITDKTIDKDATGTNTDLTTKEQLTEIATVLNNESGFKDCFKVEVGSDNKSLVFTALVDNAKITSFKSKQATTNDGSTPNASSAAEMTNALDTTDAQAANAVIDVSKFTAVTSANAGTEAEVEKGTVTVGEKKYIIAADDAAVTALKAKYEDAVIVKKGTDDTKTGEALEKAIAKDTDFKATSATGKVTVKLNVAETAANTSTFTLQVGANEGQTISFSISDMRSEALGVDGEKVKCSTQSDAEKAITTIDKAIKKVSSQRSSLGAKQNRLEHTIANLDTSSENLQTAESRIRDVDMAKEMVTYSKNNILQQAAQSMLAQANQSTQGVLSLLQ